MKTSENDLKPYQYVNDLLPALIPCLDRVEQIILSDSHIDSKLDRYDNLINSWHMVRSHFSEIERELSMFCESEWSWLDRVDEGLVCCHTFATLVTIHSMKYFKNLDFHDQNIILFGLLFHDIAKRGPPEIDTKDPLHPFTSAAKTLKIFSRLGWIQNTEHVEETSEYISNAYFFEEWANFMDNRKLPMIYKLLLYATGLTNDINSSYQNYYELTKDVPREKLFVFEILAIILFHQSVDLDPKYPNFTPLTEEEVYSYLSPRLLNLLAILHMGDNGSYNLPLKRAKWDFDKRISMTQSLITRKMNRKFK